MTDRFETLAARIDERFGEQMLRVESRCGELTYELGKDHLVEVATALRGEIGFEMLIDVCGVDYLTHGSDEWRTKSATDAGFSRGVDREPVILDEAEDSGEIYMIAVDPTFHRRGIASRLTDFAVAERFLARAWSSACAWPSSG